MTLIGKSSNGKLWKTPDLKIGICPTSQYADADCSYFLCYSTPVWEIGLTITAGDVYVWNGTNAGMYKSKINHTSSAENAPNTSVITWDRISYIRPAGNTDSPNCDDVNKGVGKTPLCYNLTFNGIEALEDKEGGAWVNANQPLSVSAVMGASCLWSYVFNVGVNQYVIAEYNSGWLYLWSDDGNFFRAHAPIGSIISGTATNTVLLSDESPAPGIGTGGSCVFEPSYDCTKCEIWVEDKSYTGGDCVIYGEYSYMCCSPNIGQPPEYDATNVCEPGYYWRLFV